MTDYYDRDGNPMPDDWWDRDKHAAKYLGSFATSRRVARTVIGSFDVSTVWLGLDHAWSGGTPIIFETMIFGAPWNHEMRRYCTEEEALRGHLDAIDRLRAGKPPFGHLDE